MGAVHTGFLLLLGAALLIILSFDQWDMLNGNKEKWNVQHLRKQRIKEICDKEALSGKISFKNLKNLIVDDAHGLIYCYIPKVACTNWKRVFIILNKGEPYSDPMSIPDVSVHTDKRLNYLCDLPETEIKVKLKHYTKFLFVRDPFIRLISAFRDKFFKINEPFYKNYGRYILKRYGNHSKPPETFKQALESGIHLSFHNFILYLLDPETRKCNPFEPHWREMNRLCRPCLIEYDFIGHQETLQEDAEQLLSTLNLQSKIKFPVSYENMTISDQMVDWFKAVPLEDRKKLYKIYEKDFKLFGYRKPTEVLDD
ncbi:carbohydrate sulfotransferase 12-like [Echeneis naucrates]|uniref:carbohydrate sulfotransferase 12-like n=1 Tax=Echeneis naucrates TaxID=173247 RepID=UPI00111375DF|nr:carbohydrate sulfotransferase 12-like [Echeneis naucrates]